MDPVARWDAARARCKQYRLRILEISRQVTAAHVAPAFSCVEIVDAIYHHLMERDPQGGYLDTFIMSKGHGCLAQYVVLEKLGILPRWALDNYCRPGGNKPGGLLGAHPDRGIPGIVASTGSLGHGLSMAVGMACADRLNGSDQTVFCLLSDGELQEGSTWEAIMMAGNLRLSNLVVFVDNNDFGGLARMTKGFPAFYPLGAKVAQFGWWVNETDGHDTDAILRSLPTDVSFLHKPAMVVCQTVKGQGVSFMIDQPIWHYRSPNDEEYERAVKEINDA